MQQMDGYVAVVTGASRGVGRGVAEALASAGATVFATGRTIASAPPASAHPARRAQRGRYPLPAKGKRPLYR